MQIIRIDLSEENFKKIEPTLKALKIEYVRENSDKTPEDLKQGVDKYL